MSTDSEGDPLAERVWTYVCPFRRYLLVVAILEIVFLVLLVFSLAVGVYLRRMRRIATETPP